MIATIGSTVTVCLYQDQAARARDDRQGSREVRVNIISAGPPGTVADWGLVKGEEKYILVRKAKNPGNKYEAVDGDMGAKDET